ncbi:MAG: ribonuclease P protein component [Casimicrobium sp.]
MAGVAFPREARLLTPDAFTRALKTRPFRGKFLWVYRAPSLDIAPNAQSNDEATESALAKLPARPQLGMMIGKRNAKSAVLRNAIKRRVREQFRLRQPQLPPFAYVVRLATNATKADIPNIVGEWVNSLEFDIRKNSRHAHIESGLNA